MSKSNHLVGVGLDNEDGHKRLTSADNFTVVGGSAETHERATETLMKTNEELRRRGKSMDSVSRHELAEIVQKSMPS